MKKVKIWHGDPSKAQESYDYLLSLGYKPYVYAEQLIREGKVYGWYGYDHGISWLGNDKNYFDNEPDNYQVITLPTKEAPPLGLRPKAIVDALRIQEILEAMMRYAADGKKLPQEWVDELSIINSEKAE
jgi:hypothetical protein